jgi:hypothetical protein
MKIKILIISVFFIIGFGFFFAKVVKDSEINKARNIFSNSEKIYISFRINNSDDLNFFTNIVTVDRVNFDTVFAYCDEIQFYEFLQTKRNYQICPFNINCNIDTCNFNIINNITTKKTRFPAHIFLKKINNKFFVKTNNLSGKFLKIEILNILGERKTTITKQINTNDEIIPVYLKKSDINTNSFVIKIYIENDEYQSVLIKKGSIVKYF